ncbi:putative plasmid stability protein [Isoalcanivorax pacificus W11-5]|uniref:Putative plasmid stability protein n=1 Tax=Isoalcanivorax pacificus W11-5 TaxID=391936 RepID=A0A0B4XTW6_9GAMM|nr:plasmid stability protein [Isoalcanivorax pacificus]AJD49928.1 putative plasmid stability protein [Isoalcanivorax pacificus W11-5]
MNDLTIMGLDKDLMARLADRAAKQGRSIEEEARDILRITLYQESDTSESLVDAIQARVKAAGIGVDFDLPSRDKIR